MASLVLTGDTSGQVTVSAPAVAGTTTITMPAVSGTMVVLPTTPSMVRLNTANGYGSTNTVIRRFTTAVTNQGSDITYADSATLGATFTINTTGIYSVSYTEAFTTAGSILGISLNSNQLTTAIYNITQSNILMTSRTGAGEPGAASWTGLLTATDVIRAHTAGNAAGTVGGSASTFFTIVRVS